MKAIAFSIAALAGLGLFTLDSSGTVAERQDRVDCPGKIVCPRTGDLVCRDKCPTVDPQRADCPGRIVCPESGELVCIDRCPLRDSAAKSAQSEDAKPSCCQPQGERA